MMVTPKTVLSAPNRFGLDGAFNESAVYIKGTPLKVLGYKRDTFGPPVRVQFRDEIEFRVYFSQIEPIK